MKSIPTCFFATAAVCALLGMGWGIQMSATHDHALSPAHGHLNLIGFVMMAVFGTYYALTPRAARARLALVHFALAGLAIVLLVPGIVMALTGQGDTLAKIGSVLAVLSMAVFAYTFLRHGVGAPDAVAGMAQPRQAHPAE